MGYATKGSQPGSTHRRISPSHRLHVISHRASSGGAPRGAESRSAPHGQVHCLCINVQHFSSGDPAVRSGVGRNIPGMLPVSTPPRSPVDPTGYTTCRPYRPPSRVCIDTASTFGCIPSRRGVELLARVVEKVRSTAREIRVGMHRTARSPASIFALRRRPGVLSRSRVRTSSGWPCSPRPPGCTEGAAGRVCRLCRTWCAHAVNGCLFRRASACHYAALGADVACHEHGTALSGFLPCSWDHLGSSHGTTRRALPVAPGCAR